MPIAVEVVSPQHFARWVTSKGGTMPGARPANAPVNPDSTQANTLGNAEGGQRARPDQDAVLEPSNEIQATTNQPVVLERSDEGL